jgi:SAM-dependent methyltransferase
MTSPFARLKSLAPGRDAPGPEPGTEPSWEPFARGIAPAAVPEVGPITELLYSRLTPEQIAAVPTRLNDEHRWAWDQSTPEQRMRLTLAMGLLYGVEGVSERTGLSAAEPPSTVHSMVRGIVADTGGSYYLSDMVAEMLQEIGRPLPAGAKALDFSCSSGRVVRPLAAALPQVTWYGCDPNGAAIEWASSHLAGTEFFTSGILPPLPFSDADLQLAFAISVWSHFNAASGLRWLEEMSRVVAPGGHLLLTTHGMNSCAWFSQVRDAAIEAKLGEGWLHDTARRLQADGHCFWSVFDADGDWGVVDADWGLAFFTPEWLLAHVTPLWALRTYRIGRAHGNQDVYLLERS